MLTIRRFQALPVPTRIAVVGVPAGLIVGLAVIQTLSGQYHLAPSQSKLLSKPYASSIKIKETDAAFSYNLAADGQKPAGEGAVKKMVLAASKTDATGKEPYQATVPKDLSHGITFASSGGDLSFKMTPEQSTRPGQQKDGYLVYPGGSASQHVYTFKRNGLKEDILLTKAPGDTATYSWNLSLGSKLEAKLQPDGSVGVYSADQALYGDISVDDAKTQALIDNAKQKGTKTSLTFLIPKPFIIDAQGHKNYAAVNYSLAGDKLTLTATDLKKQKYPLSIDPTVVVSTTADFQLGTDDGAINYGTSGEISRGGTPPSDTGGWLAANSLATARLNPSSVAYNGYLYVMGGETAASTYTNTVEYAAINADGSLGAYATTSAFTSARRGHSAVAYNGYMYIISGSSGSNLSDVQYAVINANGTLGSWSSTTSIAIGRSYFGAIAYNGYLYVVGGQQNSPTADLSDVSYAPLNSNGTVGTWNTTTPTLTARTALGVSVANGYIYLTGGKNSGTDLASTEYAPVNADGTIGAWAASNALNVARSSFTPAVYNGYFYAAGGLNATDGNLKSVEYARINADGTLTGWMFAGDLPAARIGQAAAVYNGYLYLSGGTATSTYESSTIYAPLNANGTITSTWKTATSFTTARYGATTVAANGYLYVMGGYTGSVYQNDVQYAAIDASGKIGTWQTTTSFTTARYNHTSVAANGFIYVVGGRSSGGNLSDVQYAKLRPDGSADAWQTTTSFTTARYGHASIVANGYLFVLGGYDGSTYYATVQSAQLSATLGTLGSWTGTTAFTTARTGLGVAVSGTSMFITGGTNGTLRNDVQSATITAGTVGAWTGTTAFTTARTGHTTVAANGFLYVVGGTTGTDQNDVQYAAITAGAVGTWSTTGTFSTARQQHASVVYGGNLYIVGGLAAAAFNDVQYAPMRTTGTLGPVGVGIWKPTTSISGIHFSGLTLAANGYIYRLGGGFGTVVQYAVINLNGSIGSWQNTTSFTTTRSYQAVAAYNGYIYIGGGSNGTRLNDMQYAPINTDGTLGAFTTTSSFNLGRENPAIAVYNNFLYIMGGLTGSYQNDVQYASINTDGSLSAFTTDTTTFSLARRGAAAVAYNGYMYMIGGQISGTYTNSVQYAVINPNGTLGAFTNTTVLPTTLGYMPTTSYNGRIYVLGGHVSGASLNTAEVRSVKINADGTLGAWESNSLFTQARNLHGGIIYNGYAYIMDGNDSGNLSDVQYAPVAVAPAAIVNYERLIDLGSNAHAVSVTYNGTSTCGYNDLTYRTASSGNPAFSAPITDVGAAPGVATIINAVNVRYILLKYRLDDSYCGTTSAITDITVSYTVDAPVVPVLAAPANAAPSQSLTPAFQMSAAQVNNSYLKYKIEVCSVSDCSSVLRTIDQTSSQTGWTGQDQQTGTAYAGNTDIALSTLANHTYQAPPLSYNTQYWWRAYAIDPGESNTWSAASAINTFNTNATPAVPTLIYPSASLTGVSTLPQFRLSAPDVDSDYLKYKIEICSISDCSVVVTTADQTSSQTGWQGQSEQASTAYTAGQTATYQASSALTPSTQYWWRAYAIDPAGANTFTAASAIGTFTTNAGVDAKLNLGGGTTIRGGTRFGN